MKTNLSEAKKLLVVVDLVNGFVREGAMADPYIQHIIPESERRVRKFLKQGDQVVYVREWHKDDCTEFKRYPKHCMAETFEAEMVEELTKYEDKVIIQKKNSTSAMFAYGFEEILKSMKKLEEVVIIGCCTDICVLNLAIPMKNYFDEQDRDIAIVIPKNAVETYDAPIHPRDKYNEIAFKLLKQAGIKIVNNY